MFFFCLIQSINYISSKQYVMDGIQKPYLYEASALSSFAFHKEDLDANSINRLHRGLPKFWQVII